MTGNISFTPDGWEDYVSWLGEDKRTLRKIVKLIEDITRNGYTGIGHPEPLKDNFDT